MARLRTDRAQRDRPAAAPSRGAAGAQSVGRLAALQRMADVATAGGPLQRSVLEEEELLQGKALQRWPQEEEELQMKPLQSAGMEEEEPLQGISLQRQGARPNATGLPDGLKSGVEQLSGHSLDDVRVHYNSERPAAVQAHAYAQGSDIHLAPGQERHLPHEAWHVVQQAQGRVPQTTEVAGQPVNDDAGLEREADTMGARALSADRRR